MISILIVVLVVLVLVVLVVIFHPFIFKFLGIGNENTDKDKTENEKEGEKEKKLYIYLNEFYSIEHDQYNYKSKDYNYNKYIFNETGLFQICVFGASSINGGRGGLVCGNYSFEVNEILYYGLGGREAGGEAGINCGISKGKGINGAGRAYAKCINGFQIVAGGEVVIPKVRIKEVMQGKMEKENMEEKELLLGVVE